VGTASDIDESETMSESRPPQQERLWEILRTAGPPVQASERVRERIEESIDREALRRPRHPALRLLAGAAVAAALVWIALGRREPGDSERADVRVVSASNASQGRHTLAAGQRVASGPIQVGQTGRLRVALERAEVDVAGPAAVEVRGQGIVIHDGKVEVRGSTSIAGPGCRAEIAGRAEVEVSRANASSARVIVTVYAGSVSAAPAQVCELIDLTAPHRKDTRPDGSAASAPTRPAPNATMNAPGAQVAEPSQPVAPPGPQVEEPSEPDNRQRRQVNQPTAHQKVPRRDNRPGAPLEPSHRADLPSHRAGQPSALARQVEGYRAAARLQSGDPAAALARFEAMRANWPRSPLRHEIDLAIIDLLVRLKRLDDARAQARQFLERHPSSPRRAHVAQIASEN
jgi:hypothetical protein